MPTILAPHQYVRRAIMTKREIGKSLSQRPPEEFHLKIGPFLV